MNTVLTEMEGNNDLLSLSLSFLDTVTLVEKKESAGDGDSCAPPPWIRNYMSVAEEIYFQ